RRISLGSFAHHDVPSPVASVEVAGNRLRVDSDFTAEGFSITYGILQGDARAVAQPLNLNLSHSDFKLDFDYYVPRQASNDSVCVSGASGTFLESQSNGACIQLAASDSPFTVTIPIASFGGSVDLTDIDQLTISVGSGVFSPARFSLAKVTLIPEPSAMLLTGVLLVFVTPLVRRAGKVRIPDVQPIGARPLFSVS
ncbi:MAG: hypothetical protein KDB23_31815, partial [Planctomycetales bacterium]|nr:hypothetical protein [Planctomycetales bacterium]